MSVHNVNQSGLFDRHFPICLAPMVGLTHAVQRQVIQEYMPKNTSTMWPTEMLNSRRIPFEGLGHSTETFVLKNEQGLVPQILGNDQQAIQLSIQRLKKEWDIAGVDINMGCPVQKALRHNYGVALMGDVNYAADVVRYAVQASQSLEKPIPVSVKLRAVGSDKSTDELIRFVEHLVQAGADWITLHPRSPEQQRRGSADWSQIAALKKNISVPVIGNGDIQIIQDVQKMLAETGADKVMIGRALIARPWLVAQWGHLQNLEPSDWVQLHGLPDSAEAEGAEYGRMFCRYIELCEQHFKNELGLSENLILRKILFFVKTSHVWLEFGHTLYGLTDKAKTIDELKTYVHRFFQSEQRMVPKTELRQ